MTFFLNHLFLLSLISVVLTTSANIFAKDNKINKPQQLTTASTKANSKSLKKQETTELGQLRKKVTSLLILKQRQQALTVLHEYQKKLFHPETMAEIIKLKSSIITQFLTQESQDYFEQASNLFTQQPKQSLKLLSKCLEIEPENLYCNWLQLKHYSENKKSNKFLEAKDQLDKLVDGISSFLFLKIMMTDAYSFFDLNKTNNEIDLSLVDKNFINAILEYHRSFSVKNFSLSLSQLNEIKTKYADYPDILFYEAQIESLSEFNISKQKINDLLKAYKFRCDSAPQSVIKKYFFDLNFCKRKLDF